MIHLSEILYRTESAYGSKHREIIDVMQYEIFELNNSDILDYLIIHHTDAFDVHQISRIYGVFAGLINTDSAQYDFCRELVEALNSYYNVHLKYCLWLASKSTVLDLYNASEQDIQKYETSPIILSDLGMDVMLFAYESMPRPLN